MGKNGARSVHSLLVSRVLFLAVFSAFVLTVIVACLNRANAQSGGGAVDPQSPSEDNPSTQGVIRIAVNLVQVDVVVTDSKGHLVSNLVPQDFEIREDGRVQTITNFSYITTGNPGEAEAQAAVPRAAPGMPCVSPARLAPEQVQRSMVVLVDDLHIQFGNLGYVRQALNKFIDEDVQPGDLVAILHTSGGLGIRQQFTNDKRVLHSAVDHLRVQFYGAGPDPDDAAFKGEIEFNNRARNGGTFDALKYVLSGLRDLPGRKAVFFVSEGMILCSPLDGNCSPESEQERLNEVADLANRCAAVVYSVSAAGLPTLSMDASMGTPGGRAMADMRNPQPIVNALNQMQDTYNNQLWTLAHLAEKTEGLFFHNNNDIALGMHKLMGDLGGYYLIGYKPPAEAFSGDRAGRGFHHIEVKLRTRGLHLRTRPGFYGIPDGSRPLVAHTREAQLKAAITSPFGATEVPIQLAAQVLNVGENKFVARLRLHIDVRDLTFQDQPDGSKKGTAELLALAYGDNGQVVNGVDGTLNGKFQPEQVEALRRRGANYHLDLPLNAPGGYQVRVAVRDPASQKVGSASQFVDIPHPRADRVALSGIVLNAEGLGESGPAVRRLKAGSPVTYDLEIYNAQMDGTSQAPSLESTVQIFHDGRPVSTPNPGAVTPDAPGSNRLEMSGEFALDPSLPPGDYSLLVTVTDKLAPPRHASARQWIDFEVVP